MWGWSSPWWSSASQLTRSGCWRPASTTSVTRPAAQSASEAAAASPRRPTPNQSVCLSRYVVAQDEDRQGLAPAGLSQLLELRPRAGVDDAGRGQPGSAGGGHAVGDVGQRVRAVGVGVHADENAGVAGQAGMVLGEVAAV